jgi:tetratricopeptide (TPR) repeat protein
MAARSTRPARAGTDPERWFPLLVVLAAVVVYANTLRNGFVWDDVVIVVDNPNLKDWRRLPELLSGPLAPGTLYYRPLQALTFAVDYAVAGLGPAFFHATNVALHAAAALLFYYLSRGMLQQATAALIAAALFAVHPVHTEAVAYVSGRADSLAAIAVLGALLLRSRPLLSAAAFLAALLARESGLVLLLLTALLDAGGVPRSSRRDIAWRWAAYLVVLAVYLPLRAAALRDSPPALMSTEAFPLHVRLLTMVEVLVSYLGLLVVPVHLHMERIVPAVTSPLEWRFLASLALLVVLAVLALRLRRAAWPVFFGLAWFVVTLLPVMNVVPLDAFMAEHWLYVPSMGIFMAAGWAVAMLLGTRWRPAAVALSGVALVAYGGRTVGRNADWRNERSIFQATARDSPTSFRAVYGLGSAYLAAGDLEQAAAHLSRALPLARHPLQAAMVHTNLGLVHLSGGDYEQALHELRRAIEVNGPDAAVYTNQGAALLAMDRPADAVPVLEQAIATNAAYAAAHLNLAVALEQLGKLEAAKESYTRALRLDPDSMEAYLGLGDVHLAEGRPDLAEQTFRAALRLQPGEAALQERVERARAARTRGAAPRP